MFQSTTGAQIGITKTNFLNRNTATLKKASFFLTRSLFCATMEWFFLLKFVYFTKLQCKTFFASHTKKVTKQAHAATDGNDKDDDRKRQEDDGAMCFFFFYGLVIHEQTYSHVCSTYRQRFTRSYSYGNVCSKQTRGKRDSDWNGVKPLRSKSCK